MKQSTQNFEAIPRCQGSLKQASVRLTVVGPILSPPPSLTPIPFPPRLASQRSEQVRRILYVWLLKAAHSPLPPAVRRCRVNVPSATLLTLSDPTAMASARSTSSSVMLTRSPHILAHERDNHCKRYRSTPGLIGLSDSKQLARTEHPVERRTCEINR